MLFDNCLSYEYKIYISIIISCIWIYYRNLGCYLLLPRKSLKSVLLVAIWMYCNYYEPLSAAIGLIIMYLYSILFKDNKFNL